MSAKPNRNARPTLMPEDAARFAPVLRVVARAVAGLAKNAERVARVMIPLLHRVEAIKAEERFRDFQSERARSDRHGPGWCE